jgi:hypothetical protein
MRGPRPHGCGSRTRRLDVGERPASEPRLDLPGPARAFRGPHRGRDCVLLRPARDACAESDGRPVDGRRRVRAPDLRRDGHAPRRHLQWASTAIDTELNAVAFSTGVGDGAYPVWFGYEHGQSLPVAGLMTSIFSPRIPSSVGNAAPSSAPAPNEAKARSAWKAAVLGRRLRALRSGAAQQSRQGAWNLAYARAVRRN